MGPPGRCSSSTVCAISGARRPESDKLRPGDQLHLRPESDNDFNALAVLVTAYDDQALGWVPDLLADYVQHALSMSAPAVRVSKVNGEDTPPNLRLLVEFSGQLPVGYRPFGPLADQAWHDNRVGPMDSRARTLDDSHM